MGSVVIVIIALVVYGGLYFTYGKWLERRVVGSDPKRPTPAHVLRDGVDYEPANRFVLFGHHFASIAGAAPIVGPAIAMAWGWLPGLLWVLAGNVFIGAVHDYLSLMASVRYDGKSVQWVASRVIDRKMGYLFGWFILAVLILVVAAFAAIVGGLFVKTPEVATSSSVFILLAPVLGYLIYKTRLGLKWSTLFGLLFIVVAILAGFYVQIRLSYNIWMGILFVYIVAAASLPVTVLLQPRDYMNSWLLVVGLAVGAASVLVAHHSMALPAFSSFSVNIITSHTPFWPVIPLIIACGSLSGFHALVASGTTSKQLDSEASGLFIGYGAMFTEGLLSSIVIVAIGAFGYQALSLAGVPADQMPHSASAFGVRYGFLVEHYMGGSPVHMFARSYGLAAHDAFGLPIATVSIMAALWVSAFAMTSLDTSNRIARYTWTELLEPLRSRNESLHRILSSRLMGAVVPAVAGIGLAWSGSWRMLWPAFGGANQMLASIALFTVAVWVIQVRKAPAWPVVIPALLLWVTVTAALLWYLVAAVPIQWEKSKGQAIVIGGLMVLMLVMNGALIVDFFRRTRKKKSHDEGTNPESMTQSNDQRQP
ncbi:MAG: carbon starvation protein A [Deltaproteobacteria bacterium]|nr:carbon starvation protein A [Deltaproteobacteria bacterium]